MRIEYRCEIREPPCSLVASILLATPRFHTQAEAFVIHGSMSVCSDEDYSESESGSDRESGDDAYHSDRNSGPEDERDNTGTNVYIADDQDQEDGTLPRLIDTYDQDRTSHVVESLHPGFVKRRSSPILHLPRYAPSTTSNGYTVASA
jgi:hypothetical protein